MNEKQYTILRYASLTNSINNKTQLTKFINETIFEQLIK